MTTYSIPSSFTTPPQYNITLDGTSYTLTVFWQYFANRLYFTISDNIGNSIVTKPLISSNYDIDNLHEYFDSVMYYSENDQVLVIL